ncbi:MAG: hypothetical protein LBF40_01110, partial [Deltaproteobacteria bacterium]|nr:hypothetical protein [Deltaproteobacteria bacterium]
MPVPRAEAGPHGPCQGPPRDARGGIPRKMRTKREGPTPGKALFVFLLAMALVMAHEADRVSSWLEDLARKGDGAPFALALNLASDLKALSISTGLSSLKAKETRLIDYLTPTKTVGAISEPDFGGLPSPPDGTSVRRTLAGDAPEAPTQPAPATPAPPAQPAPTQPAL